jgi:hypothetical protein
MYLGCPALMSPNAGDGGGGGGPGVAGSQPMSTAVHRSPSKLWRSNSIFNLLYCFIMFLETKGFRFYITPSFL